MTTAPVSPGSVTEIEIVPSVDWLEVDDHGVWARAEPGLVILIDPTTNQIASRVQVGGEPCDALGIGEGAVWSCAGTDIVRVDTDTLEVTATHPIGKAYTPGEIPVLDGTAWVLTGDGSSLVPIDAATDIPGTAIALPVRGTELAGGTTGLWIAARLDNAVMHLDPASGVIKGPYPVPPGPVDIAVDGSEVWVASASETVRLDPATGEVTMTTPAGGGAYGAIALSDDIVWLRNEANFIVRIDRATDEVINDEHDAEYADIAARLTSSGDLVIGFDSVWTSAYDDGLLFRIAL